MSEYHTGRSLGEPLYLDDLLRRFVPSRRVCIQAGGHKGAWPYFLARYFESVITFEPFHENFVDLAGTTASHPKFDEPLPENVYPFRAGLWHGPGRADFVMNGKNKKKGHVVAKRPGRYPLVTIDGVAPHEGVDFVCLDIEGAEVEALHGARRVLHEQHPVLAVEVNINKIAKGANYRTTVEAVLGALPEGYRDVETYGLDRVFVHG